jgi:hypothetical protein
MADLEARPSHPAALETIAAFIEQHIAPLPSRVESLEELIRGLVDGQRVIIDRYTHLLPCPFRHACVFLNLALRYSSVYFERLVAPTLEAITRAFFNFMFLSSKGCSGPTRSQNI